ncbi:ubiquitin carboxyl-terminal hydrolase, family 1 [Colletotrichum orchidophilum]|uniref:Ubiquitin carboxyl-terminal hydrolase n=1 Tax=Colletotrichum orchidophilum TaxID=1209926 RepID=A0A1G4BSM0_9PEZI|nr:ubiquitin carboxyl-terminal hydrolase, family 1 [Colletotrichum orchidophilum]OHF04391.1 ubiquitin carboxyl-terminal hydrolase, family 1 [Colletotrichum orchidophilum]
MASVAPPRPDVPRRQLRSRQASAGVVPATTEVPKTSDIPSTTDYECDIYAIETSPHTNVTFALAGEPDLSPESRRLRKRKESPCEADSEVAVADSRRNPKRKATETAAASQEARDYQTLLRESLAPLDKDELKEWEGWCEVESEPAFFNAMLREMGVKDVKVQEVFSVDEDYVATLPQPVYGLIFLYQYFSENYEDDEVVDGRDVWFANQTTDNACATVAMTNILMNSAGVDLGQDLQNLKDSTSSLSTPLRGHALSSNTFIRSVHNSFTRRMDHLNADLFLETEAAESKKKKRRGPAKKKKRIKKQKIDSESGYHFIAYVPANGSVWELDGLKTRPVCLGPLEEGVHWANLVQPEIQARMFQFEESALSFNLLALCKSPLKILSGELASTIRSFELLESRTKGLDGWQSLVAGNKQPLQRSETERIAGFGIYESDIEKARVDPAFEKKVTNPTMEMMELFDLHTDLVTKQKALMGEYNTEIGFMKEDDDRVQGRKKDHTPAIHCWMQKLAEHGVIADWAADS